jgi:hypothetical protein
LAPHTFDVQIELASQHSLVVHGSAAHASAFPLRWNSSGHVDSWHTGIDTQHSLAVHVAVEQTLFVAFGNANVGELVLLNILRGSIVLRDGGGGLPHCNVEPVNLVKRDPRHTVVAGIDAPADGIVAMISSRAHDVRVDGDRRGKLVDERSETRAWHAAAIGALKRHPLSAGVVVRRTQRL